MATKKKKAVNYQKLYYALLNTTERSLNDIWDIKCEVMKGEITQTDLQETLTDLYYKLSSKVDILDTFEDGD